MTHLPYIIASYGITIISIGVLSSTAWLRLKRAQRKLIQLQKNLP